jgi:hypothetical protein
MQRRRKATAVGLICPLAAFHIDSLTPSSDTSGKRRSAHHRRSVVSTVSSATRHKNISTGHGTLAALPKSSLACHMYRGESRHLGTANERVIELASSLRLDIAAVMDMRSMHVLLAVQMLWSRAGWSFGFALTFNRCWPCNLDFISSHSTPSTTNI